MLSVAEAREIVFRHCNPKPRQLATLNGGVLGMVLTEDAIADIDSPPFDKSMMDGYAVRAGDCAAGGVLKVVGEVQAGAVSAMGVNAGEAVRIFTGAPIPLGADAVVKQEETTVDGERVTMRKPVNGGANILRRGEEMRAGEVVLPAGTVIGPVAVGLLAAVGKAPAPVHPCPKVGIIATGNELVDPFTVPTGGQIRNTNGPMLAALVFRDGGITRSWGIATDEEGRLASLVRQAIQTDDIIVLSGGVSVGKYDLVPNVLKSLGVQVHFHKVNMKPGKPLLFGTLGDKLVFGLPGNPVSALLGFELFVGPAIRILGGHTDPGPRELKLPLSEPLTANHDRPTYHPAVVGEGSVRPLPWKGSADLRALLPANGYVLLPPGEVKYDAGDVMDVIRANGAT